MNPRQYFFTSSSNERKGPFTAREIAELTRDGLLQRDAVVFDSLGRGVTADEIERIEKFKGNKPSPGYLPPPPPTPPDTLLDRLLDLICFMPWPMWLAIYFAVKLLWISFLR